jgi:Tfp pilus assembly protein PilO
MSRVDVSLASIIGLFALLTLAISFLGVRPLLARWQNLQKEAAYTANELSDLEKRAATLTRLTKDKDEIAELGRRSLIYLPVQVSESYFVMDITAIASSTGTNVPTLSFQESGSRKASTEAAEYPVAITVEGNFEQLKRFLQGLEENLRFSTFSSLTISQQKEGLSLQLGGTIFSKREGESKDKSLLLDQAIYDLLQKRRPFGGSIKTDDPARPDPFGEL